MPCAFAQITVPVDGSTTAERAIAFGLELARDGGRVTFGCILDGTAQRTAALAGCERALELAARLGVAAGVRELRGRWDDAVTALVRAEAAHAIVVGHPRPGGRGRPQRSIGKAVLLRSDAPFVVVHEDDTMRTGPLVVAIDESIGAQSALAAAIRIGAARRIPLLLVHVCEPPPERTTRTEALLSTAAARARESGVGASIAWRPKGAADELLALVEESEGCMVAIGTNGSASAQRPRLGSVAAAVVERAAVPVLTVRAPAGDG